MRLQQLLSGVSKSYLPLIIRNGMVTCGAKLRVSASGGRLSGYNPPPMTTATLMRFSRASNRGEAEAPELTP